MSDYEDNYIDDGQNYFWVEDSYGIADDLAEHSVASPVPYDDLNDEEYWDDLSRFEYWIDIEYDSDGYNDVEPRPKNKDGLPSQRTRTRKRKQTPTTASDSPSKRRKLQDSKPAPRPIPVVSWKPKARLEEEKPNVSLDDVEPFALLKDWREKFPEPVSNPSSTDAAADDDHESTQALSESNAQVEEEEEATGLDPAILKMVLRRTLSSLGLDASRVDESLLLTYAARMLTDQDHADEIVAELAEKVLSGQDEEGDDEKDQFSQWVSGKVQGATTTKETTSEGAEAPTSKSPLPETIPAVPSSSSSDATSSKPNHVADSTPKKTSRGSKRKADSPVASSRKKVDRAPDQLRARS